MPDTDFPSHPEHRSNSDSLIGESGSQSHRDFPGLLFIVLVIVFAIGCGIYWFADRNLAPSYSRGARIDAVAWGTDGSLYLQVMWVVSNDRTWEKVVEFNENSVYRFDPHERILRKLPMEDARRIIARWPAIGWVGGRYTVTNVTRPDSVPERYITTSALYDWNTGNSLTIDPVMGISPDDRYILVSDSRGLPVVHWIESGQNEQIPDSVISFYDYVRKDHYVIRVSLSSGETRVVENDELVCCPRSFFATKSGILDADQRVVIDPLTFNTTPGWGPIQFGPGGIQSLSPDGRLGEAHSEGGLSLRGTTDMAKYNMIGDYADPDYYSFTIPMESVKWRVPEEWKDQNQYPGEYTFPKVQEPS